MFDSKSKNAVYFEAFSRHAKASVEASGMLVELLEQLPSTDSATRAPSVADLATRIKRLAHEGDEITHETMKRVRANWITPLDREDIQRLMNHLDDVLDAINEASDRVIVFELTSSARATELAKVVSQACGVMARAVDRLSAMKEEAAILELCKEVNRLENVADTAYRNGLAELYKPGADPLEVMKRRDVLECLEGAADRCEDVANVVESIVLEYA